MKAQRRHELEQNKLAQWVARFIQRVRPHASKIILAAVGVLGVIAVVSLWRAHVAGGEALAWDEFIQTINEGSLANLVKLAEEHPGSSPGIWAALEAANAHLRLGCELLFDNKQNAADELRKAVALYSAVIESARQGQDDALGQAHLGRARAYEALCGAQPGSRAELAKAIADYEEIGRRWSSKPYAAVAARQLALLQSERGKEFYTKFADFTPKPPPSLDELLKKYPLDSGQFPKEPSSPADQKGKPKTPEKPRAATPPAAKPAKKT